MTGRTSLIDWYSSLPVFHPSYGVPRKACPLSIRWALYKNQTLVSALPYPDIGVIAEFDEGVNTLSTVSQV
jgi:hypothetical protein